MSFSVATANKRRLWLRLSTGLVERRESPGGTVIVSGVVSTVFESVVAKKKTVMWRRIRHHSTGPGVSDSMTFSPCGGGGGGQRRVTLS